MLFWVTNVSFPRHSTVMGRPFPTSTLPSLCPTSHTRGNQGSPGTVGFTVNRKPTIWGWFVPPIYGNIGDCSCWVYHMNHVIMCRNRWLWSLAEWILKDAEEMVSLFDNMLKYTWKAHKWQHCQRCRRQYPFELFRIHHTQWHKHFLWHAIARLQP